MNIFYLASDPIKCARQHCDKHVIKMILETAQMLSTAHRLMDGKMVRGKWRHPDQVMDAYLYRMTHTNHPSAIWIRESRENYKWAYQLLVALNDEYMRRYGREEPHRTMRIAHMLRKPPKSMKRGGRFTAPPQCVPDDCKRRSVIKAYRDYYREYKAHFATWKNTPTPKWFLS